MSSKSRTALYIVVTFVISYAYQFFIYLSAPDVNSDDFGNLVIWLMYLPGIIALCFAWKDRSLLKHQFKVRYPAVLLYSLIIPLAIAILLLLLIEFLGIGHQSIISFANGKVVFLEQEPTSIISFLSLFLFNFCLSSIFTGVFTIGEEIGWRGYLQNKLIEQYGVYRGITTLGIVWGYWHLPIIFMGYNFPDRPLLGGFILMPLTTIGFSGIFAWLTLKGRNIWSAVLAHSAINSLLSNSFISRIETDNMLNFYLLLTFIWLASGIFAMVKVDKLLKQSLAR